MQNLKIPFRKTQVFDEFFLKYVEESGEIQAFFNRFPKIENFQNQILDKKGFPQSSRNILVDELKRQYAGIEENATSVTKNIELLGNNNTFTITTGHQLNIFTGPLYFIYKIVTVINLAKQLKKHHPEMDFVPIYWMASEDHDYEEIKAFRLYEKTYSWETAQSGAVGKFHLKDMPQLLSMIPGDISIFAKAYSTSQTLAEAGRKYVNALFGDQGLVVIDADTPALKKSLIPIMEMDIFQQKPFQIVSKTNAGLKEKGIEPPINPREINFFYLDKNLRCRIEKRNDQYIVIDTDIVFSKADIEKQISTQYQKFSPNVILRPIYQELILPNLAYIGGPSEITYWLQLKDIFEAIKIPFPILTPRNFGLIINKLQSDKIQKTGIPLENWFLDLNSLKNQWIKENTHINLSLDEYKKQFNHYFKEIHKRCTDIDSTLNLMVKADAHRIEKILEKIEKKMLRSEKRLHIDKLRQISAIKEELFPNGNLQERVDNFLNFYQQDKSLINNLLESLDPLDLKFNVLIYDN